LKASSKLQSVLFRFQLTIGLHGLCSINIWLHLSERSFIQERSFSIAEQELVIAHSQ